jgi:hypothetical protein
MMKQCVFLFLFSIGAHGIRLQPSRQSLQQRTEPVVNPFSSVMDTINAGKEWHEGDLSIIGTCELPWGPTVSQPLSGANWDTSTIADDHEDHDHAVSFKEKTALGFKDKTSRDTADDVQLCEEWLQNERDKTQSPIYNWESSKGLPDGTSLTNGKHWYFVCTSTEYKSQTDVRARIYEWKHTNFGGSYRIEPWMYLCAGMTANGDPHVVNILGETFDIVSQGEVELVRYPKGADDSSSKLIITASIDKLGQGCHDTYMKKITVSGAWLKESISFKDNEDNGNILVSQGSDARLAPMEMNKMNGSDAVKLDSKQIHFATPKRASLTVAGVTQVVVYTSGRPHKGVGTYLNLDLQGFTNLEGKVGGLLGQDSHKKELDLAKDLCRKTSVAKSRAFHQKGNDVPLHEDNRVFHVEIH